MKKELMILLRDEILGCTFNNSQGTLCLDPVKVSGLVDKLGRVVVEAGWTPPNPMTPFRVFVLHDGEDAERTKDLHKFMEGVDWEGEYDGIVVWLHVTPGDIIRRGEHSFGVVFGRRREK